MTPSECVALQRLARRKPISFIKNVLGVTLSPDQKRMVRSVWENERTAAPAGHGVGKSLGVACIAVTYLFAFPYSKVVTTANTFTQVTENIWSPINHLVRGAKVKLGPEPNTTDWVLAPEWFATGISTNLADSFQGKHGKGGTLVIFDECQMIPKDIWAAAESLMSGENCRWLAIANPTMASGNFHAACNDPDWTVVRMSCLDHPNVIEGREVIPGAVTKKWVESMRRKYGEDSDEWRSRVLGLPPLTDEHSLISLDTIRPNVATVLLPGRVMGVDIARKGKDSSAAVLLVDGKVEAVETWQGRDLMQTTGYIIDLAKTWNISLMDGSVKVDGCGLGAGVYDRLTEQGYYIDSVDAGSAATGDWGHICGDVRVLNRKAELWWAASILFRMQALGLDVKKFPDLARQLTSVGYDHSSNGAIRVEKKEAVKKREGGSPDMADALILALSRAHASAGIYLI